MKKTLMIFLLLISVILHGKGNFADANSLTKVQEEFEKERQIVENLFNKRAELWNLVYDEADDIEVFQQQLQIIEADPLLSYDLKAFKAAKQSPTDLDKVVYVSIIDIKDVSYGRTKMTAAVKACWTMQGKSSYYYEEIGYTVSLIHTDGQWKLCDYDLLQ